MGLFIIFACVLRGIETFCACEFADIWKNVSFLIYFEFQIMEQKSDIQVIYELAWISAGFPLIHVLGIRKWVVWPFGLVALE